MNRSGIVTAIVLATAASLGAPGCRRSGDSAPVPAPVPIEAPEKYLKAPGHYFEPNLGQTDPAVEFLSGGPGYEVYLSATKARIALRGGGPRDRRERQPVLTMSLVGGANVSGVGESLLPSRTHYYKGREDRRHIPDIPHYERVRFPGVYPGIDVCYYGTDERRLEYDFVIAPGADPSRVRLAFGGASGARLDEDGTLILETASGRVRQPAPISFQETDGQRRPVDVAYVLEGTTVSFLVGGYDRSLPLVIDPEVLYERDVIGFISSEAALDVTADGTTYLVTPLERVEFDGTVTHLGAVIEISPEGALVGNAVLELDEVTVTEGVTVDPATGRIYVAGYFGDCFFHRNQDPDCSSGEDTDSFGAWFPSGLSSAPVVAEFLGGSDDEPSAARAIKVTASGNPVVVGVTEEFSTRDAYFGSLNENDTDGGPGAFSRSRLGGTGIDEAVDVAVFGDMLLVTGRTNSTDFPGTGGSFQPSLAGGFDQFVASIVSLDVAATYLGSSSDDVPGGIAADAAGNVYVSGGRFAGLARGSDAYVASFTPGGALRYQTTFGTTDNDLARSIDVDSRGRAYVAGVSRGLPSLVGQPAPSDGFLTVLREETGAVRETHTFTGADPRELHAVALGETYTAYVVGATDTGVDRPVFAARLAYFRANDDTYQSERNIPIVVAAPGVLGNDTVGAGDPRTATLVTPPTHAASFFLAPDGSFAYVPSDDFIGTDAFQYRLEDAFPGESLVATVSIEVSLVNRQPVATDDYVGTAPGVPLTIVTTTLLQNDHDPDGDALTFLSAQSAVNGTVSSSSASGTVTFTLTPGATSGTFTYTIRDNGAPAPLADTATVTVRASQPPAVTDDSFALPGTGTLVVAAPGILANDSDAQGESLSAVLATAPVYGTLSLDPLGGFTYVADRSFPGMDAFSYRARDAGGLFSASSAFVTLTGTPRTPGVATTTDEDTPVVIDVTQAIPGLENLNPPPEEEVVYCYDGYDAVCGGSDAPATAFAAGRLTRARDKAGEVAYAYDGAGRQVRETRTLSLPGESRTLVTERAFDENGNAVSTTLPTGVSIEREFDETNRETRVAVRAAGGASVRLIEVGGGTLGEGWFPYGGPRAWRAANGTRHFRIDQDSSGWVTRLFASTDEGNEAITYNYARDGNVIGVDVQPSQPNVGHDTLGRLTYDRGNFYSYDDAGNRLSGPGGAVSYPDPQSNRWSSAEDGALEYEFDSAGNVTQRGELALVTADDGTVIRLEGMGGGGGRAQFLRDHRNLRLASIGSAGNERFVYSPTGDLEMRILDAISESCGLGELREVLPVEHYIYVAGRRVAMVAGRVEGACGGGSVPDGALPAASAGERYFYFSDKMDLARAVFRAGDGQPVWRAELDAFGVPIGAGIDEDPDADGIAFAQPFRLPGQEEIRGTELSENWNRVFDSVIGRYLQPDPLEKFSFLSASSAERQGLEVYGYVHARPLDQSDRLGLAPCASGRCPDCPGGKWLGGVVGVAAVGSVGPAVVGGEFISGALVCTSRPAVGMMISSLCVGGAPLIKTPGLPTEEALGIGAGIMTCLGVECIEDIEGVNPGVVGIAGPVMVFTFYNASGGGCVGAVPMLGGGAGASFGLCSTFAN